MTAFQILTLIPAGIVIFHPVPLTILIAVASAAIVVRKRILLRYPRAVVAVFGAAIALYLVDLATTLPRITYARNSPTQPIISQALPLPNRLTLVNLGCGKECHSLLLSGALDDVVLISSSDGSESKSARRYRVGWSVPGACPRDREFAIGGDRNELLRQGFCPIVESVEVPTEGVFVVRERLLVLSSERARAFNPRYLVDGPPGKAIRFDGIEVQRRAQGEVQLLASTRYYVAPGFLGIPPLIGCWSRPENIIWTMPPGDTGCGLWRWFTGGGDRKSTQDLSWIYSRVFAQPDRKFSPPERLQLQPSAPEEALEILSRVEHVEDYASGLRKLLTAPSVSDEMLVDLVVRRARRGRLEGSLVALLAVDRPSAALAIPARLDRIPTYVNRPDLIVSALEADATFRKSYEELMFDALAAIWLPHGGEVARFLEIMTRHDADWLCRRLDRMTGDKGIVDYHDRVVLKNYVRPIPEFLDRTIDKAIQQCGALSDKFLGTLLASPHATRRESIARIVARRSPETAEALSNQAVENLIDVSAHAGFKDRRRRAHYFYTQAGVLRRAGYSCADIERRVARAAQHVADPNSVIQEWLEELRASDVGRTGFCGSTQSG